MKKILSTLFLSSLFLASSANAMRLNLTLSDDIINNNDAISFSYVIYQRVGNLPNTHITEVSSSVDGMPQMHLPEILSSFNAAYASAIPVDNAKGQHSRYGFGYMKADGTNVHPVSCQNILAKQLVNVILTETGCLVS